MRAKRFKLCKGYPLFIIVIEIVKVTLEEQRKVKGNKISLLKITELTMTVLDSFISKRESAAFCERGIYLVPLERLRLKKRKILYN